MRAIMAKMASRDFIKARAKLRASSAANLLCLLLSIAGCDGLNLSQQGREGHSGSLDVRTLKLAPLAGAAGSTGPDLGKLCCQLLCLRLRIAGFQQAHGRGQHLDRLCEDACLTKSALAPEKTALAWNLFLLLLLLQPNLSVMFTSQSCNLLGLQLDDVCSSPAACLGIVKSRDLSNTSDLHVEHNQAGLGLPLLCVLASTPNCDPLYSNSWGAKAGTVVRKCDIVSKLQVGHLGN